MKDENTLKLFLKLSYIKFLRQLFQQNSKHRELFLSKKYTRK